MQLVRPLLTYASLGWFLFLSVTNITTLERLYRATSRTISGCLPSFPTSLLLSEASLPRLRVTLTHFALSSYERAFCFPTFFPISDLARLGVNQNSARLTRELFHLLTLPSTSLGRFVLLAFLTLVEPAFFTVESFFPLHAPTLSLTLTLFHFAIWCF